MPNLRYYFGICLEGLKENTRNFSQRKVSAPVFELRSADRSAATFCERERNGLVVIVRRIIVSLPENETRSHFIASLFTELFQYFV